MWLLRAWSRLMGVLPLSVVLATGRCFGLFLYLVARSRRGEMLDRIQDCLGVDRSRARAVVKGMYRNLGMTVHEILRLPHISDEELKRRVKLRGQENAPESGAFISVGAHTGNWEYMASAYPVLTGRDLAVVVKSLKPPEFNDWLTSVRSRWGTAVIDRRGSVREILKVVKSGRVLGFMMDQNAKRNWGIFVDFFGTPACTTDGLAQIAARTKVPVVPVFSRRTETNDHEVIFGQPLEGPRDNSDEEIHRVTAAATKAVEDFVRTYPDQWIWMHRRWRTKERDAEA